MQMRNGPPVDLVAWHYTTGERAALIERSGVLMPATAYIEAREIPVVWFSTNPLWEPTACKLLQTPDGRLVRLTMEETYQRGGGLVRFGIDPAKLYRGDDIPRFANITKSAWRQLCNVARMQGANPSEWGVLAGRIDIAGLAIQSMNDCMEWAHMLTESSRHANSTCQDHAPEWRQA
ncbi:hypothetical protein [Paraburkholderia sp. JPY419]|uniref:hypothetical protein n=1 Tax=Paraburkholderia sp. JPY419 TaxID=667660 RepID=UPI003D22EC13